MPTADRSGSTVTDPQRRGRQDRQAAEEDGHAGREEGHEGEVFRLGPGDLPDLTIY